MHSLPKEITAIINVSVVLRVIQVAYSVIYVIHDNLNGMFSYFDCTRQSADLFLYTANIVFYFKIYLQTFVREKKHKKTWFEARDFCREIGGDLAAINSEEEQRVIEDLIT